MSDAVKEQVSACLDTELPKTQLDLLVKRVARDGELCEVMRRYALIGEALRSDKPVAAARGFAADIMAALDQEPAVRTSMRWPSTLTRHLRPVMGMAVAAGVAGVVVLGVQQLGWMPGQAAFDDATVFEPAGPVHVAQTPASAPASASASAPASGPMGPAPVALASNGRQPVGEVSAALRDSYTVPEPGSTSRSAFIPATRLTNYVVAHSEYSSPLGRRSVLTGVLADDSDSQLRYSQAGRDGAEADTSADTPAQAP
jgi:negative regulator of sigma E activity